MTGRNDSVLDRVHDRLGQRGYNPGREVFEVIAKQWIVERTLGGLDRCHRLSQDDEAPIRGVVAMIRLAQ
jgi:hypothetical protein